MSGAAFLSELAVARGDDEMLARCLAMAEERRDAEVLDHRACAGIAIAQAALERGDSETVQAIASELVVLPTLAAEYVDKLFELSIDASIADGDDQLMEERRAYLNALKPARTTPLRRAGAARLAAELAHRRHDEEAALQAEVEAETLLRNVGAKPQLARTLLERARRRDDRGALDEARSIYEQLGASRWLEQLDQEFEAVA